MNERLKPMVIALAIAVIAAYWWAYLHVAVEFLSRKPFLPSLGEGPFFDRLWGGVSVLVGSIVAVALGQPEDKNHGLRKLEDNLIVIYGWSWALVGASACFIWATHSSPGAGEGDTPELIRNVATAFLGLVIPVVAAFFRDQNRRQGDAGGDFRRDRDRSNFGADGVEERFPDEAPTVAPTIDIDWTKVTSFLTACETSKPRVGYQLGAKIPNDAAQPGKDFTAVDCSGFVRAAIRRSSNPKATDFPDGSVVQNDWVRAKKFTPATVSDGKLKDDKIRIAFLAPADAPNGVGHVVLIRNATTVESHGGVGPDSRPFDGTGWQAHAYVYVLKD